MICWKASIQVRELYITLKFIYKLKQNIETGIAKSKDLPMGIGWDENLKKVSTLELKEPYEPFTCKFE